MSNPDCWGLGDSVDTHIVGVWNKKDKVTFGYPRCPQGPGGPESAQNVKSSMWVSTIQRSLLVPILPGIFLRAQIS